MNLKKRMLTRLATIRVLAALAIITAGAMPARADHYDFEPAQPATPRAQPIILAQASQSPISAMQVDCPADMPAAEDSGTAAEKQFDHFLSDFTRLGG